MSRDTLSRLDRPSNDSCFSRLSDYLANGLTVCWLEVLGELESTLLALYGLDGTVLNSFKQEWRLSNTWRPNAQDQKRALFGCIGGFIRSSLLDLVVSLNSAGD